MTAIIIFATPSTIVITGAITTNDLPVLIGPKIENEDNYTLSEGPHNWRACSEHPPRTSGHAGDLLARSQKVRTVARFQKICQDVRACFGDGVNTQGQLPSVL